MSLIICMIVVTKCNKKFVHPLMYALQDRDTSVRDASSSGRKIQGTYRPRTNESYTHWSGTLRHGSLKGDYFKESFQKDLLKR